MTKNNDSSFDINEWTLADQRFIQSKCKQLTAEQIAKKLDRPTGHIRLFATSCNIILKKSYVWSAEDSEFLINNVNKLSRKELALHLGRSVDSVYNRICVKRLRETDIEVNWSDKEDQIIINNWYSGILVVLKELQKAGYIRFKVSVLKRAKTLHIGSDWGNWEMAAMCPQMHFFSMLCHQYGELDEDPQLTYPILSALTYTPLEKIQKMFMSGPLQETMTIQMRHHFWIVVEIRKRSRRYVIRIKKRNELK